MNRTEEKIKMLLTASGKTQKDVAEEIGYSKQSFYRKLQNETLKPEELEQIANICGAQFLYGFRLKDGREI